jgi:hypothetical protein
MAAASTASTAAIAAAGAAPGVRVVAARGADSEGGGRCWSRRRCW